jgi:hypothetical protein
METEYLWGVQRGREFQRLNWVQNALSDWRVLEYFFAYSKLTRIRHERFVDELVLVYVPDIWGLLHARLNIFAELSANDALLLLGCLLAICDSSRDWPSPCQIKMKS